MTAQEFATVFQYSLGVVFLVCCGVAAIGFVLSFVCWERKKSDHDPFKSEERIRKQLKHHW